MLPTADTLRLLWHMLAGAGTLVIFLLFAYEVVRARSLAKAQRLAREQREKIPIPDLPEREDPWAPRAKRSSGRVPSSEPSSLSLKAYQRPMWRGTEY